MTDPMGNSHAFTYTGDNLTMVATTPAGSESAQTWSYTYTPEGLLASKTDPLGKTTSYTYDASRRVNQATAPDGRVRNVTYPTTTTTVRSTTLTEQDGGIWTYTYDTQKGLLNSKTDSLGNSTSYTYDSSRHLLTVTDPKGNKTTNTYDALGNLATVTDPLGKVTSYTYNAMGEVTSATDPLSRQTLYGYDEWGNRTSLTDPTGAVTSYVYDERGNLTSVTDAANQTTIFTYDESNNRITTTDATGAVTTSSYDTIGNVASSTDPLGNITAFEYDSLNQLIKVTDPLGNITRYTYDAMGNKTSVTDANGRTTSYEYNHKGKVEKATDAIGNITAYTYGASGCPSCGGGVDKLTALTDAKNQTSTWWYNLAGQLTQEIDPLQKATSYAYDPAGNLTTRTDANGASLTYLYDALNRLTRTTYPDNSTVTYTYDNAGRVVTAANSNITYTYTYDADDRVTSVTDSRGYAITYQYDALGKRTQTTLLPNTPDERIITYSYDHANRQTGITSSAGLFTLGYDAAGRRGFVNYPNLVTATYGYDNASRLTSLGHQAIGQTIASSAYTLDNVGNRTTKSGTCNAIYTYDGIYRLITATASTTEAFTYDPVGNRLTGPASTDTGYLSNAGNQTTQDSQFQYSYDNNGNQTARVTPNDPNNSWTQTWDYENRLARMENANGQQSVTFKYDPMGRRIEKKATTVSDGIATTATYSYLYDNAAIALEILTDDSGTTKTFYTHGPGIDEPLALERSGLYYYFHADGLGSLTAITDQSRNIVQSYEYSSFGAVTQSTEFRNSFTYTGREWDPETGLYYYNARYYDPIVGRFISKDPIGFDGGDVNLYAYVGNNITNFTDPTGLTKSDPWYGYNNKDFQRWFHRCWKEKGGPRVTPEEDIAEAYAEWLSRGAPKDGRCWGKPPECEDKKQCVKQTKMVAVTLATGYTIYKLVEFFVCPPLVFITP